MDSEDRVKIGDFGLATSSPLTSLATAVTMDVIDGASNRIALSNDKSSEIASNSGQLTGQIGTVLYVAPELKASGELKLFRNSLLLLLTACVKCVCFLFCFLNFSWENQLQRKSRYLQFRNNLF